MEPIEYEIQLERTNGPADHTSMILDRGNALKHVINLFPEPGDVLELLRKVIQLSRKEPAFVFSRLAEGSHSYREGNLCLGYQGRGHRGREGPRR
jgi:hypothetical protein